MFMIAFDRSQNTIQEYWLLFEIDLFQDDTNMI